MRSKHLPGRSWYKSESQASGRNTYQVALDTRVRVGWEANTYQVDLNMIATQASDKNTYQVDLGTVVWVWWAVEKPPTCLQKGACHLYVVVGKVKHQHLQYTHIRCITTYSLPGHQTNNSRCGSIWTIIKQSERNLYFHTTDFADLHTTKWMEHLLSYNKVNGTLTCIQQSEWNTYFHTTK